MSIDWHSDKIFRYIHNHKKLFGIQPFLQNLKSGKDLSFDKTVNWTPLYITGKEGFSQEIFEALESSNANYLPGYLYDNNLAAEHAMYWIPEKSNLKDFKNAIGASLIWKYRLKFYTDLETLTASLSHEQDELEHEVEM